MSAHTPGPWSTHAQGDANHYAILLENGKWLAALQFNGEQTEAQQLANAKLIAAVPELLQALADLVANQRAGWIAAGFTTEQIEAMPYLKAPRAALAKATGAATEQPPRRLLHDASRDAAVETMMRLGYTYHGEVEWKPPAAAPKRKWVGISQNEIDEIWQIYSSRDSRVNAVDAALFGKNT